MRWVITGLIFFGLVYILSGCGVFVTYESQVRSLPSKVSDEISLGDTREKVHSVLGTPLVDSPILGVEVYRHTGLDIDIHWPVIPIPIPAPGDKVLAFTLVSYDENGLVQEIDSDVWDVDREFGISTEHYHGDLWITANNYHFSNNCGVEPETLLGPSVSWRSLAGSIVAENGCKLVLVMGEWVMEKVSLDGHRIADLSPAGSCCAIKMDKNCNLGACIRSANLSGTFLRIDIDSGTHQLSIKSCHGDFEKVFECEADETVYAEIKANPVHDYWWGVRLEGEISITKTPANNVIDMGTLYPILWHGGTWYMLPTRR